MIAIEKLLKNLHHTLHKDSISKTNEVMISVVNKSKEKSA